PSVMAKRLTTQSVAQAKPDTTRREIADGGCPGLYLVVQPSGAKSWALRFRSPVQHGRDGQRAAKKLTLGPATAVSLAEAREMAPAARVVIDRGTDPTATKRAEKAKAKAAVATGDSTIDAAMLEFLRRYKGRKQQGLRDSTRQMMAHYY